MLPLFVDSDNALGAPSGDVDDAFALAYLFASGAPIAAVTSVRGNASEEWADRNNRKIGALCGYTGPYLRGARRDLPRSEAAEFLVQSTTPHRVVALGPLTNVAAAIRENNPNIAEIILVGTNATSSGRWPPLWPHEFNLTLDRSAARVVFGSGVPLVIGPLDLLRTMRIRPADLTDLQGELGSVLRRGSRRWFRRARLLKWSGTFPVWDLVAAIYAVEPDLFETEKTTCRMHHGGWVEYGEKGREVTLLQYFDRDVLWKRFVEALGAIPTSG